MLTFDDLPGHIERLATDGYTLFRGLLERQLVASLRDEVLEIIRVTQPPFPQLQQSSQYCTGSLLDRLINSDEIKALSDLLHEGPSLRFLPFTAVKAPGGTNFQYHQDNQYRNFDGYGLNFWFALQDIDETNGCLYMVPGSHKLGPLEWVKTGDANNSRTLAWEPTGAIPIAMRAGDCIAFDRLTIHGSGENRSGEPRVGYSITFHDEDASFEDVDGWKPLKTHSRWRTPPTDQLRPFTAVRPGGHR